MISGAGRPSGANVGDDLLAAWDVSSFEGLRLAGLCCPNKASKRTIILRCYYALFQLGERHYAGGRDTTQ